MVQTDPRTRRCWVEIDLAALKRNWASIKAYLPESLKLFSVLKANAYGHGMEAVARAVRPFVHGYAVANVEEASQLRTTFDDVSIMTLSPTLPNEVEPAVSMGCLPTLSSVDEALLFSKCGLRLKRIVDVTVKIDTGMGRAGIWHEEAFDACKTIQAMPNIRVVGMCSHFSNAGVDLETTRRQRHIFEQLVHTLHLSSGTLIHIDNSPGLRTFADNGIYNSVRVGQVQFGASLQSKSSLPQPFKTERVLSFHTRVALIKKVPANTAIGYEGTYRLKKNATLAVLSAGYEDGVQASLANAGYVLIRGEKCPIIGRISMDQTIVDVTHVQSCAVDDVATLIGQQGETSITLFDWFEWTRSDWHTWMRCVPAECLCAFNNSRIARIFTE